MKAEVVHEVARKYKLKVDQKRLGNLLAILRDFKGIPRPVLERVILENLLVGESYFFRERQTWRDLKRILPTKKHWRVVSLGCSRGEEVYTFSFVANDAGIGFNALGVDLNRERISVAQSGRYGYWSVRFLSREELRRYFHHENSSYIVKDCFRDGIEFRVGNILDVAGVYDLVMLRKVLIYYNTSTITKLLQGIRKLLSDDGFLVLGRGEYYPQLLELFDFKRVGESIFWCKSDSFAESGTKRAFQKSPIQRGRKTKTAMRRQVERVLSVIESTEGDENPELEVNTIEEMMNLGAYANVLQEIEKLLSQYSTSSLLWKYRAVAQLHLGLVEGFEESLERAIYLNPEDEELWVLKSIGQARKV